jgi:hypothetical protein
LYHAKSAAASAPPPPPCFSTSRATKILFFFYLKTHPKHVPDPLKSIEKKHALHSEAEAPIEKSARALIKKTF